MYLIQGGWNVAKQLAEDLAKRGMGGDNDSVSLSDDMIWGVAGIAKYIGRTERATFHLLETGQLPAGKLGSRWWARGRLRQLWGSAPAPPRASALHQSSFRNLRLRF